MAKTKPPKAKPDPSPAVAAFLAEYRDLVHRHGLGILGDGLAVGEVTVCDAHVAEIEGT